MLEGFEYLEHGSGWISQTGLNSVKGLNHRMWPGLLEYWSTLPMGATFGVLGWMGLRAYYFSVLV